MKGTGRLFFMTFRNMAVVRLCLIFVLFMCVDRITGKPIFFDLWCDYICDDDDVTTTTSSSDEDWFCDCRPRRRTTTTSVAPPVLGNAINSPALNMMIPPGNGMNMTMFQLGNNWFVQMIPGMSAATPAPASTQANQATTAGAAAAGTITAGAAASGSSAATTAATTAAG